MKKFLLLAVAAIASLSASALDLDLHYKGYVETGYGLMFNQGESFDGTIDGTGSTCNFATSHGVELFKGAFVGLGVQLKPIFYQECEYNPHYESDTETSFICTVFAEGRYNILRERKISPFVGLRIGGGYQGLTEDGTFYFSPMAGCTFNLTEKFGLDVNLAYNLYTVSGAEIYGYSGYETGSLGEISLTVGIHF